MAYPRYLRSGTRVADDVLVFRCNDAEPVVAADTGGLRRRPVMRDVMPQLRSLRLTPPDGFATMGRCTSGSSVRLAA
jgi:hypothetical protein